VTRDRDDELDLTASREEQARATALGDRVDELIAGAARPPAMQAEERALLEIATSVRASAGETAGDLSPLRIRSIVDGALASADDRSRAHTTSPPAPDDEAPQTGDSATETGERVGDADAADELSVRRLAARAAPWLVAIASAAAAVLLAAKPPAPAPIIPAAGPRLAESLRSRPADAVVGRIDRAESAMASSRIDAIYADRMRGFRALSLAKAGGALPEEGPQ